MDRLRAGKPSLVVNAEIVDALEHLGLSSRGRLSIVKRIGHADAIQRVLLGAGDLRRRRYPSDFKYCRHDVADEVKLVSYLSALLDAIGPAHNDSVTGAAE